MDFDKKILVVDDFPEMRRVIKGALKKMGFSYIIEAEDGDVALKIIKEDPIDLILADWNMPKMNGLELLKAVRHDEALKSIPFIMVTAEGRKGSVIEVLKAGAEDYIMKPFTTQTLGEKIRNVLGE